MDHEVKMVYTQHEALFNLTRTCVDNVSDD
jgi:hypothetical protein